MMITQNHRREDFDFSTLANICDEYDSSISSQSSLNSPVDERDNPHQSMTETIPPTTDPDYLFEINRLKTFDHNWPHSAFLDPRKMAAAGFYYLGEADICRCVFCNVKIGHWEVGDDPMREHQRWADYCSFVRHRPSGNVPITVTNPPMGIPSNSQENQGYDECGMYNFREMMPVEVRPNSTTEKGGNSTLEVMGVTKARAPSFPHMGPYDSRLNSFKCWPKSIKQRPEELCEAGFYYSGKGDQTICYHCGGGLKDWEASDDPWTEHAKWFSQCAFLILVKGKAFVDKVQEQFKKERETNNKETASKEKTTTTTTTTTKITETTETTENPEEPKPSTSSENADKEKLPFDDPRLCKICYVEEAGVVFLPCGHFIACVKCAPTLSTCAICRQPFSGVVRAFLS